MLSNRGTTFLGIVVILLFAVKVTIVNNLTAKITVKKTWITVNVVGSIWNEKLMKTRILGVYWIVLDVVK